jgi:hypothetical protein
MHADDLNKISRGDYAGAAEANVKFLKPVLLENGGHHTKPTSLLAARQV